MGFTYDVELYREQFEHEYTWLNGFMRNVARMAGAPAIYCPARGLRLDYAGLNARANRLARALMRDGVGRGALFMYMLFNSIEFACCYIAGHKSGGTGCPVNYRLAPGELGLQLDDSRPKVLVVDAAFAPTLASALDLSAHRPFRVVVAGLDGQENRLVAAKLGGVSYEDYVRDMGEDDPVPAERQHIYDETTRLYTSGTTSLAKAVPLNSINELLSAHDVMIHFPLNSTDRTMNMTPWFHRGGLHSGGITPTLYAGGEVVVLREFHPRRCLELAAAEKVTFLIGVPSVIALLARAQKKSPADLSALRGMVSMGSPFGKAACEEYLRLFTPNIFNGYGTTETFWNTFLRPHDLPHLAGRTGRACVDDDVRVVRIVTDGFADPSDMVARDNSEVGEIIIKSPAKSAGSYAGNPEQSARKFHKGFHYTGDVGTWDSTACVSVLGRKDDMIICAGENVYPSQIEEILAAHPGVAECAVVGRPDRLHGNCVAAYVVPSDSSLTEAGLRAWCVAHPMLPPYKRPRFITLVEELPRTATGKVMRYRLREDACASDGPAHADKG